MEGDGAVMDAGYVQRLRKAIRLSCKGQEPQQRETNTATVKAMVRSMPDGGPEEAAAAILLHLQGTSCDERQHALVLTDVLFKRSQAFRGKIISTMDSVLAFSTGCRPGYPLPGPPEASRQLKCSLLPPALSPAHRVTLHLHDVMLAMPSLSSCFFLLGRNLKQPHHAGVVELDKV
jgi:hypothetical protein